MGKNKGSKSWEIGEGNIYVMIFKDIYGIIMIIVIIAIIREIIIRSIARYVERFEIDNIKSPCNDRLTDVEYLVHMIPHHMVAVDVSYILKKRSRNTVMQDILRNLIWMQEYEITMMNSVIEQLLPEIRYMSDKNRDIYKTISRRYISSVGSFIEPNKVDYVRAVCDPNFFDVNSHRKHIKEMGNELDEIMYIKHMIPHHQVAVDMSKRLLRYTNNPFMMELCYRIIRNQEKEIVFLNDMLDDTAWLSVNNSSKLVS